MSPEKASLIFDNLNTVKNPIRVVTVHSIDKKTILLKENVMVSMLDWLIEEKQKWLEVGNKISWADYSGKSLTVLLSDIRYGLMELQNTELNFCDGIQADLKDIAIVNEGGFARAKLASAFRSESYESYTSNCRDNVTAFLKVAKECFIFPNWTLGIDNYFLNNDKVIEMGWKEDILIFLDDLGSSSLLKSVPPETLLDHPSLSSSLTRRHLIRKLNIDVFYQFNENMVKELNEAAFNKEFFWKGTITDPLVEDCLYDREKRRWENRNPTPQQKIDDPFVNTKNSIQKVDLFLSLVKLPWDGERHIGRIGKLKNHIGADIFHMVEQSMGEHAIPKLFSLLLNIWGNVIVKGQLAIKNMDDLQIEWSKRIFQVSDDLRFRGFEKEINAIEYGLGIFKVIHSSFGRDF